MIARRPAILLIAVVLLALCVLASLFVGSPRTPADQVAHYLLHPNASNASCNINILRVQRATTGALVGAVLTVADTMVQTVTRSSLAEPRLFDVNASASLSIVLGTAMLGVLPISGQLALAIGRALVATALVQVIDMIDASSSSPVRLMLIGATFLALAGAVTRSVILTMPNLFRTPIDWEVSSLTRTGILLLPVTALVVAGIGAAILLVDALDNITLGDSATAVLGIRVVLVRSLSLVVVTVLCATAITVASPIGFAGLMVPPTASWLIGPYRGRVMTLYALGGPVVTLVADVLRRVPARPGEMQIDLSTAFIGSPVLLLVVLRMKDWVS